MPQRNNIGVDVYDLAELRLAPEVDLGECVQQVTSAHEVDIGRIGIDDALDGYQDVVESLHRIRSAACNRGAVDMVLLPHTFSSVMASADNVSIVTITASFLRVPASRSEWASTAAPGTVCQREIERSASLMS